MTTIALAAQKGGVGKTTLAYNLACALAYLGCRVAMIDTDPQANLSILAGVGDELPGLYTLLMTPNADLRDWLRGVEDWRYTPDHEPHNKGLLAVLPSNADTAHIHLEAQNAPRLRQMFQQLTRNFDYVIIDFPPTLSLQQSVFMGAADAVLIPTICETLAVRGVVKSIAHVEEINSARPEPLRLLGIIPNKYKATVQHNEALDWLREKYGDLVWPLLPDWIAYADANTAGRAIHAYLPGSEAANQMLQLVYRLEDVRCEQ